MKAALKAHTEVMGILIEGGANMDLQDNDVSSADWL